jgi:Xaa-Pro aminopeptidase
MDFGALYQGYCSDMTRTVCIGKADAELKRIYETVLHAQLAGLEVIRAGAVCAEVDKVARDIIDGAGYKGCFGHSLGHGVGMFIHEAPRLSAKASGRCLVPGNVVTVEPGIYIFGKYGCRIEDMVAVTDTGYHNFTASPKELIELF